MRVFDDVCDDANGCDRHHHHHHHHHQHHLEQHEIVCYRVYNVTIDV